MLQRVYKICDKILRFGGFLDEELNKELNQNETDSGFITALCYGVIDKSFEFDYIIGRLCEKSPKNAVKTILKIGLYQLKYMDVAKYAAVDNTVELCKKVGKTESSGFVNAVLKKFIDENLEIDESLKNEDKLSIKYSYPKWIVEKYLKQYGMDAEEVLAYKEDVLEHIRLLTDRENFISLLKENKINYKLSILDNALYCDYKKLIKSEIDKSFYIGQNLGSMLIVNAFKVNKIDRILDLCAAPGGKSAYMASLSNEVLACDISGYKANQIYEYINRLKIVNVKTAVNDATVFNEDFGVFDKVLCDVPCSGLGIIYSKPDIKINRKLEDIKALTEIQYKILETSKNYVKAGGLLMYSTCTLLKEENEDIIIKFLENNKNFKKIEEKTILPHLYNTEGFYYCLLKSNIDIYAGNY